MAVAFPPEAPQLRAAFNEFLAKIRADGTFDRIVKEYYPTVSYHFPDFFKKPAKSTKSAKSMRIYWV